jgi:hypothetical protein
MCFMIKFISIMNFFFGSNMLFLKRAFHLNRVFITETEVKLLKINKNNHFVRELFRVDHFKLDYNFV